MPKFEVEVTTTEIHSETWLVEAETQEDAEANYFDGEFIDNQYLDTIDWQVEESIEVEE